MKRKLATLAAVLILLAICGYFVQRHISLEAIAAEETRLRSQLDRRPLAGFFVGLLIYTALSFLPPTAGKAFVFGWLFGLWQGVLLVNFGLTIAAILTFLFSRSMLRDGLWSRFHAHLTWLEKALERDGAFYVLALRMMHAPYTFTNYALGATGMEVRSFWWATQLGMLPGNIVIVYAGTQIPTLSAVAEEGISSVVSFPLIIALALVGIFPLAIRWATRRVWRRIKKNQINAESK